VLQDVAECCSMFGSALKYDNRRDRQVCWSVFLGVADCCRVLQGVVVSCRVLQCVAVCCSVLRYLAVCGSVLQHVRKWSWMPNSSRLTGCL